MSKSKIETLNVQSLPAESTLNDPRYLGLAFALKATVHAIEAQNAALKMCIVDCPCVGLSEVRRWWRLVVVTS